MTQLAPSRALDRDVRARQRDAATNVLGAMDRWNRVVEQAARRLAKGADPIAVVRDLGREASALSKITLGGSWAAFGQLAPDNPTSFVQHVNEAVGTIVQMQQNVVSDQGLRRDLGALLSGRTTPQEQATIRATYDLDSVAGLSTLASDGRRTIQSEGFNALRSGTLAYLSQNGVEYVQWQIRPNVPRSADICDDFADRDIGYGPGVYQVQDAPIAPHPWCFPGLTPVSGRFHSGYRSYYTGDVVYLRTAHGLCLSVTPNHPILTPSGWVAAGLLREGNNLFRDPRWNDDSAPGGNEHHSPSPVSQVFRALARTGGSDAWHGSPKDFNGDAQHFRHGHVDVVGSARLLLYRDESARHQRRRERFFVGAEAGKAFMSGSGAGDLLRQRALLSPHSGVGGSHHLVRPSLLLPSRPVATRFVGSAAQWDTRAREDGRESVPGDAQHARHLLHGLAGLVAPDHILHVEHYPFSGHVYDLGAEDGWIVASGILTSNCACLLQQVLNVRITPGNIPSEGSNLLAT